MAQPIKRLAFRLDVVPCGILPLKTIYWPDLCIRGPTVLGYLFKPYYGRA
jgi:hypothetical protein